MVEIGQREFTQAKKPVRVPSPFHLEFVSPVEGERNAATLDLVDDGAIVNALYGRQCAITIVEEFMPLFANRSDINRADSCYLLGEKEVVTSLLPPWIHLE